MIHDFLALTPPTLTLLFCVLCSVATADLQPFYGETGVGEVGRRPGGMFHLAAELDSEPEFIDGYSCLETIVEENSGE